MMRRSLALPARFDERSCPSCDARYGLSLLEVVIATVILAGALAVLGQLIEQGRSAAGRTAFELQALARCESAMDAACVELSGGVTVPDVELEEGGFVTEVFVESAEMEPLQRVTVITKHINERGTTTASVTLTRLVMPLPDDTEGLL